MVSREEGRMDKTGVVLILAAAALIVLSVLKVFEGPPEFKTVLPVTRLEWIAPESLVDRVAALELQLSEHDKQYHFTCDWEDCLSVDELLNPGIIMERTNTLNERKVE